MRIINKKEHLASEYFKWILTKEGQNKKYNSSNNEYYTDVVMNLLYCQKGICAYTEIFLASTDSISKNNWNNGRYINDYKNKGQLEHFDPILKQVKGWDWDNLFVVDTDTNTKIKKRMKVDYVLKPDMTDYKPEMYLSYNWKHHKFIPNRELKDTQEYDRVIYMIDVLGLNFSAIVDARRIYFKPIEDRIKKKLSEYTSERNDLYQFFTAFEMSGKYFKKLSN